MQHLPQHTCRMRVVMHSGLLSILLSGGTAVFAQGTHTVLPPTQTDGSLRPTAQSTTQARMQPGGPSRQSRKRAAVQQVSLSVRDSTVAYVVRALATQSRLQVVYDTDNPLLQKRVTVTVRNAPVMEAFTAALKGTGLSAMMAPDGETVVIRPLVDSTPTGQKMLRGTITGRVTDSASGKGIAGAMVSVQGIRNSTTTNEQGQFTLRDIPAGNQIVHAKLFGFRPISFPVTVVAGESASIVFRLSATPTELSGVVTTATGVVDRKQVGNDITRINVDSVIKLAPIMSVTDLLESRVPGLTVLRSSGTPGAPSRIRLRGASSLNQSNDPIVVVDGVRIYAAQSDTMGQIVGPYSRGGGSAQVTGQRVFSTPSPIDQLDPNSIETIEVFKGPSAAAMYGSDAASGVIIITTKRGRAGPTVWLASLNQGISYMPGKYPVNAFRFGHNATETSNDIGLDALHRYVIDSIVYFQALNDPHYTVLGRGLTQGATATVSGGIGTLDYSITGSTTGETGILKLPLIEEERYRAFRGKAAPGWMRRPDNYSTWGLTNTLGKTFTPREYIKLTNALTRSMQQSSSLDRAIQQLLPIYNNPTYMDERVLVSGFSDRKRTENLRLVTSAQMSWQPISWLPVNGQMGMDILNTTSDVYHEGNLHDTSLVGEDGADRQNSYAMGQDHMLTKSILVSTTIPLRQSMSLALGITGNSAASQYLDLIAENLLPGVTQPSALDNGTRSTRSSNTFGWWAEPRLNVKSRFFVMPGFRLDQNGLSGKNVGASAFPVINLSWLASEEPYFPFKQTVSAFRPRLAFGYAGRQPDADDRLRLYGRNGLRLPGERASAADTVLQGASAVYVRNLGNQEIRPERSFEIEGGFDLELWQNRFSLQVTRFYKKLIDAIVEVPIAPSASAGSNAGSTLSDNVGITRNTGMEIGVQAAVIEAAAFSWRVDGSIFWDKGRLVKMNKDFIPPPFNSGNVATRYVVGYPLFARWALPIVGYADANSDGFIQRNEVKLGDSAIYLGREEPEFTLNADSRITMFRGKLQFGGNMKYERGLTQYNTGGSAAWLAGQHNSAQAQQAAYVSTIQTGSGLSAKRTDAARVQSVNVFRINSISLTYQIPRSIAQRVRSSNMTISLQGSNVGLWTNYRGKDPNVNASPYGNEVSDNGGIPEPRIYSIKISMGNR